jgi:hypothetical protein
MLFNIVPPRPHDDVVGYTQAHLAMIPKLKSEVEMIGIYDLVDEPGRNGKPRPFPFQPTVPVFEYAKVLSKYTDIPLMVYYVVHREDTVESIVQLFQTKGTDINISSCVFVGVGSAQFSMKDLILRLKNNFPTIQIGSVLLPERRNEALRMKERQEEGIDFFVSQIIVSQDPIGTILYDYSCVVENPVRVWLMFCPIRNKKALELLSWLGVTTASDVIVEEHTNQCRGIIQRLKDRFSFVNIGYETLLNLREQEMVDFMEGSMIDFTPSDI